MHAILLRELLCNNMKGGVGGFNWSIILNFIEILYALFFLPWYISITFFRLVQIFGNPRFLVYWLLDGVRSIKEVQRPSRLYWIYVSIFTQPIWFILVFLFHNFCCNIHNVTNAIIDVYEVNNGRHYQCQSNVWAGMGIMRRRSIFEDYVANYCMVYYPTYLY